MAARGGDAGMRGYVGGFLKEAPNPQDLFLEFSDKKRAENMCRCTHQGFPQKAGRAGKAGETRYCPAYLQDCY